jgi:transposase
VVGASHNQDERQRMEEPEDVAVMLRLHEKGWGSRRIARELGVSRNTVKRYVQAGGYVGYGGGEGRRKTLDGHEEWLKEQFHRHRGNADVLRQELEKVHGIEVSLRTVERAVAGERRLLNAEAVATSRFETSPGKQLQGDFGQATVEIGGEKIKIYLCVLTLGYSRRPYVDVFENERAAAWYTTIEGAFLHFGGVPEEILVDNARALVTHHNAQTREVSFSPTFRAFSEYWGFVPKACAPYRARTKGKDERGVGYVKGNAIAGHSFSSMEDLRGHLRWWMREVADVRIHGTTGERPIDRFLAAEAVALRPLRGKPRFQQKRELKRVVHNDLCVEVDTNHYSVPWRLIGEEVLVVVSDESVVISYAGELIASHRRLQGRKERVVLPEHFSGLGLRTETVTSASETPAQLLRPLEDYEAVAGGRW